MNNKRADIIIYNINTSEIISIIPLEKTIDKEASIVLSKGYDMIIADRNNKNVIGDGKRIYLAKELEEVN